MASDLVPIAQASACMGMIISVIGVVADVRPAIKTRGDDYMITFVLCDKSKSLLENGLTIRIFHRSKNSLPQIHGLNDIAIVRNVKMIEVNGRKMAISGFSTAWIVGYLSPIKKELTIVTSATSIKPTESEMDEIKALRTFWKNRGGAASSRGVAPQELTKIQAAHSRTRKFAHVKDMQYNHFYDLMGEVVKTFPGRDYFTVYLTDYTKNPQLHCYEWPNLHDNRRDSSSQKQWAGPFGQYTLQITLWDVHADVAYNIVKVGCLLHLNNVRAKRNGDGNLEGVLHGDRRYPSRVDISLVKDMEGQLVHLLNRRKIEYQRRSMSEKIQYEQDIKEREEKKEKREELERKEAEDLNKHIITRRSNDVPTILVGDILNPVDFDPKVIPFMNRKYRTICRVIDFLPHRLEQFCVRKEAKPKPTCPIVESGQQRVHRYGGVGEPISDEEGQDSDTDSNDDVGGSQRREWEFKFALLVQGKDGATMRLMVDDKSAQFLLNMDATDLTANPNTLDKLREKLFVLWGDLEERKSQRYKQAQTLKNKDKQPDNHKRKNNNPNPRAQKRPKSGKDGRGHSSHSGNDDSGDVDDNELILGRGMFFQALVREYGAERVDEEGRRHWQRMFGLFDVMIKY